MKNNKEIVRINLTPTQKVQIKEHTGKDAESLELKVSELEERIAPRVSPICRSTGVPAIGKKRIRCSGGGSGVTFSIRRSSVRLVRSPTP